MRLALAILAATPVVAHAGGDDAFERGVDRFQREDFAGAIPPLREALAATPSDRDAELLLGIAYARTGDDADARPLLADAARADDPEAADSARIFLGVIADRDGDRALARRYYDAVARSSSDLAATGRSLADGAGAAPRWTLVAIVRPEVDSNVALLPTTAAPMPGAPIADADLLAIAGATARPIDALPVVLDETFSYRAQDRLTSYDLLANTIGANAQAGDADWTGTAGYHFEASTLGGARYELGHVGDLGLRRALGARTGLDASYTIAARDYAIADYAGYSGVTHRGGLDLDWADRDHTVELVAGARIARELTDDPALTATAAGGRAELRLAAWKGAELRADADATARTFDPASMGRRDLQLRGGAAFYIDLSPAVGLVVGGTALRNVSNDSDFDATKLTAYVGLVAAASPQ